MCVEQYLQPPLKIGKQNVEHIDHFQYLGSCISKESDATADVRARIGKSASVFRFPKTAVDLVIEKHQQSGEITSISVDSVDNGNLCWRNLEDICGYSKQT